MSEDTCIVCRRSVDDLVSASGFVLLLTRRRPTSDTTYQVCLDCARRIRQEQDERARGAIREAERIGV